MRVDMKITTVRRISQVFFFVLFLWFCIASTFGQEFWQLRGWPVNWFLQLDPLVALGNLLTTRSLYAGLIWAMAVVAITAVLGRFFCGWLCPFGSIHHFIGYLGARGRSPKERIGSNRYRSAQEIKYYILIVLLAAAAGAFLAGAADPAGRWGAVAGGVLIAAASITISRKANRKAGAAATVFFTLAAAWMAAGFFLNLDGVIASSLQTGLLDPIPLVHRSVNLVLLPLADSFLHVTSAAQRHYEGTWLIALIFLTAILLNLKVPRFYCRFVCPLGALYGILGRFALWRIGKKQSECSDCRLCDSRCEGACEPGGRVRIPECVLCMNCLHTCKDDLVGYNTYRSASGEVLSRTFPAGVLWSLPFRGSRQSRCSGSTEEWTGIGIGSWSVRRERSPRRNSSNAASSAASAPASVRPTS